MEACCPLKKGDLATDKQLFTSVNSLSHPVLPMKLFQFVQLLRAPFCLLVGMLSDSSVIE